MRAQTHRGALPRRRLGGRSYRRVLLGWCAGARVATPRGGACTPPPNTAAPPVQSPFHLQLLMEQHDALSDAVSRARHYGAIARDALGIFGEREIKQTLIDVVDFCVDRAH